jgi:ABC-type polysaccharide/polyol phosphate transport system ATPase subunit
MTATKTTYFVATHDLKFTRSFCSHALFLYKGQVIGFGPTEEILDLYENFETGSPDGKR